VNLIRERPQNISSTRATSFIRRYPAVNIHHATRYAERIGLPLNRFITINFDLTECLPRGASHAFRKLLTQRFAPWLRRSAGIKEQIPPTYVWTIEAAGGQTALHWLVHLPQQIHSAFDRRLSDWLATLTGASIEAGAIKIKPIHNIVGLRRYVLKGTEPVWAKHLGVRPVSQGVVIGKRSGFSRNLGPAARQRGGYRPRRAPFKLAA
jgi:hypothetical protein